MRAARIASVVAAVVLLGMSAYGALHSNAGGSLPEEGAVYDHILDLSSGIQVVQFVVIVLAVLVGAGTYRDGSIDGSLLSTPSRTRNTMAKATAIASATACVTAVLLGIGSFLVVPAVQSMAGPHPELVGTADRLLPVLTGAAVLTGIAVISASLGGILRSVPGATIAALSLFVLIPGFANGLLYLTAGGPAVEYANFLLFLPGSGFRLTLLTSLHSDSQSPQFQGNGILQLSPAQGAMILAAWVCIFAGLWVLRARQARGRTN